MVKTFLLDPRFRGLRVLVVVISLTSLVTLIYQSIPFTCQLSILQNGILPFIVVQQFLSKIGNLSTGERIKSGIILAAFVGAIAAAFYLIIDNIQFYFLGGRELAFNVAGDPIPTLTLSIILVSFWSDLVTWFGLIFMSIITGLLAALSIIITRPTKAKR